MKIANGFDSIEPAMEDSKPKAQNGSSPTTPADFHSLTNHHSKSNATQNGGCFSKNGFCRKNLLTLLTVLAVVIGIGLGFGLRQAKTWTKREVMYVKFPGDIFLRMLNCLILPLIVSSLISALGSLDTKLSGKIGLRAVVYYMSTTILAIILGIILVMSIKPGVGGQQDMTPSDNPTKKVKESLPVDIMLDLIRNMFPPNIIEACTKQYSTVLSPPNTMPTDMNATELPMDMNVTGQPMDIMDTNITDTNSTTNDIDYTNWIIGSKMESNTNILGLVVFSVVLGITLGRMHDKGRPLLLVFISLSDAMMTITTLVIWLSPVGVLFLVAGKILDMDNLEEVVGKVGMYTITVLVGLMIHGLVVLPILYFIFVRKLPFIYIANMAQALATAFGTSSSSATLPVSIACLEEKNGIDPRVSRFCLPIGATINMDGTALYEAVAAIFIAQFRQVPLSIGSIVGISISATAASIGAAGIPQAGLITMVMVLNVVGLPASDVTLIYVVDWFLDRFRTAINVLGDAIGSGIVAHLSVKDLESLETDDVRRTNIEMTTL